MTRPIFALIPGALVLLTAFAPVAQAQAEWSGRIEALRSADVSSLVEGLVTQVHVEPGAVVTARQPLFSVDDTDYRITVETTRSNVIRAELTRVSALQDFERTQELNARGTATSVSLLKSEAALQLADAVLAKTRADLQAAEARLARTIIRAPIAGTVSDIAAFVGSYVEPGGDTLARIVQFDPIKVAYQLPYVERIEHLGITDLTFPAAYMDRVELEVIVSDTWTHDQPGRPVHVSPGVDPETGMMTIWGEIANPRALLRPGMAVRVRTRTTDD